MDALATVLLRRAGAVALPQDAAGQPPADGDQWVRAFEADLAARGWLLDPALRRRFAALAAPTRLSWADWMSAVADEAVGADREHAPLFRDFPDIPVSPDSLYVQRLLAHLFQAAGAPCALCGITGAVRPMDPCGHLACTECFDPAAYSGCPICGQRLTADSPYLVLAEPAEPAPPGPALRLRRITLDEAPAASAVRLRDELVGRTAALGAADRADLEILVAATAPGRLDWLPPTVPARETLALLVAWALHATALTDGYGPVLREAAGRWSTATDAARALWAYSGGDPGLILPRKPVTGGPMEGFRPVGEPRLTVAVPRVRALPRVLRRAVLAFVDGLDPATAAEDVARHPVVWKRLGERLHPYEAVGAHPRAAVVFATLRGTRTPVDGPLGLAMAEAAARRPERLIVSYHRGTASVRVRSFAALVEEAIAYGDAFTAAALLAHRPGDLWRRADHLLRLAADDPDAPAVVADAIAQAAARVSPNVLAVAAAALTGRDGDRARPATAAASVPVGASVTEAVGAAGSAPVGALGAALRRAAGLNIRVATPTGYAVQVPGTPRRTFFPKGDVVRAWTAPEQRAPLPAELTARVRAVADAELTARAARLERFDLAVLDAALAQVPAPGRDRAGSAQLAGWPRGSVRPLPDAATVRLFLHWVDSGSHRVDLDLSCGFYDEGWNPVGHCDFTQLRFRHDAAVHSGDLTSAPAPLGATEFLDLNRSALLTAGVRWAVPVVLSYNDVPFELLDAAFAGFSLPGPRSRGLDAGRVMQKFGLRGDAKSLAPLVLDVAAGSVMWVDASMSTKGYGHSIGAHGARLGRLAADLWDHFQDGHRPTLLDVAAWHAAARADRVLVVHADGTATEIVAADPAATVAAVRAAAVAPTGDPAPERAGRILAAAVDPTRLAQLAGAEVTAGSTAILVDGEAAPPWTAVTAADLMAALIPAPEDD
ncbi:hypothetical protein Cs7R123_09960 [Catellatospora sp. TT07R-123]|uniref:MXAN_6230/SCO0854 family RING domain-containing protein n=1 Tax=Catellatospora sp. TT07R-123 TaxID=2733863 RepID=UPI001B229ACD|nr:MXAN_6230/SCO0854 family RING domain-containing protein [Catellatospora sp. TT07R-123]GHJ43654.1 hypothetical protein Cs7R123_09960 [Catellatospora sp. TT07R-123]